MAHAHRHSAHPPADPHDRHATSEHDSGHAFPLSVALNTALVLLQVIVGLWIGSLALLGDAGHNASDVLGLLAAWGAARLARRAPDRRHTYGFARSTILAAMFNALALLLASVWLAIESVQHLKEHAEVPGLWVMLAAGIGFVVNAGSALLFWRQRKSDLNVRGAFLHLAADAMVSLMVVVVGGLLMMTGWYWLDPVAGLLISAVMLVSTWQLLRDATDLALDAVPRGLNLDEIRTALHTIEGVMRAHDLHVWSLSTTVPALTVHLEHDGERHGDDLLIDAQNLLGERFGIQHCTIQLEQVLCRRPNHH